MEDIIEQEDQTGLDAASEFARMGDRVALLTAAVEGFAARQAKIEDRDYSADLANLIERQDKLVAAYRIMAERPALALAPNAFADELGKAAEKARSADHEALETAHSALTQASAAMAATVARVRTGEAQRDAIIWAVVLTMGITSVVVTLVPIVAHKLWS